jgi:hypothetical protein
MNLPHNDNHALAIKVELELARCLAVSRNHGLDLAQHVLQRAPL